MQLYLDVVSLVISKSSLDNSFSLKAKSCSNNTLTPSMGKRGCLTVPTVSTMVKTWCENAGLKGSYGSHTLRKTWGYWQRMERGTAVPLLMEAFGHATQQQTLAYLGIQAEEIAQIYEMEL